MKVYKYTRRIFPNILDFKQSFRVAVVTPNHFVSMFQYPK